MRIRLDLTTGQWYRLTKIAEVHQRTREEQLLWYIELGLTTEWDQDGEAILATLAQRASYQDAYWAEHKARTQAHP